MPLLPLFPLGTVLIPGAPLPLHIFEDRYRRLVADLSALPAGDRRFGVVAIRQGREVGSDGVTALYDVGCIALCTDIHRAPDGTYELEAVGTSRFRIGSLDTGLPYLRGEVEELPEPVGDDAGRLVRQVRQAYGDYRAALSVVSDTDPPAAELPDDPRLLSYLVAATSVADLPDRQAFLAEPDAAGRLARERGWLRRETALLRRLSAVPGAGLLRVPSSLN